MRPGWVAYECWVAKAEVAKAEAEKTDLAPLPMAQGTKTGSIGLKKEYSVLVADWREFARPVVESRLAFRRAYHVDSSCLPSRMVQF